MKPIPAAGRRLFPFDTFSFKETFKVELIVGGPPTLVSPENPQAVEPWRLAVWMDTLESCCEETL